PAAALRAAVARALLPWHAAPNPPAAATAPRYGTAKETEDGSAVPPTRADEALSPPRPDGTVRDPGRPKVICINGVRCVRHGHPALRRYKITQLHNGPAPGPAMLSRFESILTPWRF
ncbi:hypothetical protein EAO75_32630, partial [Streptomyces sp. uw30]